MQTTPVFNIHYQHRIIYTYCIIRRKYKRNIKLKILKYALAEDHLIKTNSKDKLKKFKSSVTSPTELHIKQKIARRDILDTFKKLESHKNDV